MERLASGPQPGIGGCSRRKIVKENDERMDEPAAPCGRIQAEEQKDRGLRGYARMGSLMSFVFYPRLSAVQTFRFFAAREDFVRQSAKIREICGCLFSFWTSAVSLRPLRCILVSLGLIARVPPAPLSA